MAKIYDVAISEKRVRLGEKYTKNASKGKRIYENLRKESKI